MSLWKRRKWYWADSISKANGLRYRVPLKNSRGRRIAADELHREIAARAEEREMLKAEQANSHPSGKTARACHLLKLLTNT